MKTKYLFISDVEREKMRKYSSSFPSRGANAGSTSRRLAARRAFISGGVAAFILASALTAQAATLTPSCAGAPTATAIAWTATSTGGIDPVLYLWNNGATSSVQTVSYMPGTYTMGLTATDASSTVATTTCSATVAVSSATTTPPTATTTVSIYRRASLEIEDNGRFKAKAMVVQSVGEGLFTAKLYGITFTVASSAAVTVGNYADVQGSIDSTTGTVTAKSVRQFPSTKVVTPKVKELKEKKREEHEERSESKIKKIEVKAEQKIQKIEQKSTQQIKRVESKKEEKKKNKREKKSDD